MNIFGLDIAQLDPEDAKDLLSAYQIERLPGIPPFLSKKDCCAILGVSIKIINQLIESGDLPLIYIPGDEVICTDLFGEQIEFQREKCILRADLIAYMEKALLCNKPILNP